MVTTAKRVTLALKAIRVLLIGGVVWLVATRFRDTPPKLEASVASSPAPVSQMDAPIRHALEWYAPLWERDLKQPPLAPPPSPAEPPPPTGPVPVLLATCVEKHGGRYAHLVGSDGRTTMRMLHELIDRYELVSIEPGRVELALGDRRLWIDVPVEPRP